MKKNNFLEEIDGIRKWIDINMNKFNESSHTHKHLPAAALEYFKNHKFKSSDCKIAIFTLLKFHSLWKILISIINDIISRHSYNFNDTMLLSTLIKRGLKFASLAEKSRVRKKHFVRGVCASSSSYSTQNTVDRATNVQRRVFMLSGFIHTGCFALFIESMSDDDKRASKKITEIVIVLFKIEWSVNLDL